MATSVKLDEATKSRLERLQAEIRLETGRRVTQQAVLERLVDEAYASKEEFIDSFHETRVPLDADAQEAFHEGTVASGRQTDEEDIDELLYG
ncbi:hypothetical protein HUG10_15800 [Halorarum halophilum]|uniref:Uncharacterized protein n=1 Tax=Halorarum halophilum TaxID=2743090 RepID=A0A7D5KFG3_9EURY|nr:hypothetical protein [Halobaculum halophilum]QLG28917.1 hypothetical protein HUG10_15800 [Halobaculum halophilum]